MSWSADMAEVQALIVERRAVAEVTDTRLTLLEARDRATLAAIARAEATMDRLDAMRDE